jgi:hypothetical protein
MRSDFIAWQATRIASPGTGSNLGIDRRPPWATRHFILVRILFASAIVSAAERKPKEPDHASRSI